MGTEKEKKDPMKVAETGKFNEYLRIDYHSNHSFLVGEDKFEKIKQRD